MFDDDFEYDVAFSFAAVDEAIATQLNDLLSPRLRTDVQNLAMLAENHVDAALDRCVNRLTRGRKPYSLRA
ncbi:protein of unknown function [Hyphomicrobium sp. 1Nfss2.1]|uniref:hypothetical protein n=1 Tax=Hyphomicrobium sp. 1Nfss2.1 TaxID=3413936 RepID=UPI003C7A3C37